MSDDPGISPIPIGGNSPPPDGEKNFPHPPAPRLEPIPTGKTEKKGNDQEIIRLNPQPLEPIPGPQPVPLPSNEKIPLNAKDPAPINPVAQKTQNSIPKPPPIPFTSVAGLILLISSLLVPNWDWARTLADGYPSSPTASWISAHLGIEPFKGDLWEGLRAALLTASGGIAAFALFLRYQKYRTISRVIFHVALTSLALITLGLIIKSLGQDSTHWDFSNILTSAGLVYPVVALFWSRPRWAQLLLAAVAFAISWYAATQTTPEDFTPAQISLLPLLPALGLMLLGLAAGETLLIPHTTTIPGKTAARSTAICAIGILLAAGGWALHHFGTLPARLPEAQAGTLLLGAGTTIALAAIFSFIPRRLLPFTVIGTWCVTFYFALHTLAPFLNSVLKTHFGANYLSFLGLPITPLAQNILITLILWLAAAWISSRKSACP